MNKMMVIGLAFSLMLVFTGCKRVDTNELGIVTTFGKPSGETFENGLHFYAPWKEVIDWDLRTTTADFTGICYSSDLQQITTKFSFQYFCQKDKAIEVYSKYGIKYFDQIKPKIFEIAKQTIGHFSAEDTVLKRDVIRTEILESCKKRFLPIVEVADISIADLEFTTEYEKAIEAKQVAQQRALAAKYDLEKARVDAETVIVKAKGDSEALRINGEALKNNQSLVSMELVKKWDGKLSNGLTILLGGFDPSKMPVLDISKTHKE